MLTIRLRRQGARNSPFYRVVLSDSRRTPRAASLEELGYYNPSQQPKVLSLKDDRIDYWVSQGAILSDTVAKLRRKDFSALAEQAEAAKTAAAAEPAPAPAAAEEPAAEASSEESGSEAEAAAADEAKEETPSEESGDAAAEDAAGEEE